HCRREDGAPHFLGLAPATTHAQHSEYAAIAHEHDKLVNQPISRQLNRRLMDLGVGPLSLSLLDSVVELADAYMQLTVPSFEFPRAIPASVHFVCALPIIPNQAALPSRAHELDGSRKIVLATQGTVANHDFSLLIGPTLKALANDQLYLDSAGTRRGTVSFENVELRTLVAPRL